MLSDDTWISFFKFLYWNYMINKRMLLSIRLISNLIKNWKNLIKSGWDLWFNIIFRRNINYMWKLKDNKIY